MRRALILAASFVLLLLAAYSAYWYVMASRAGDWVAYWAAPAPGKAWHGSFGATEVDGFPFALNVTVRDPSVTWQGGAGDAVWQGPWLVARFKPWTLASFSIDLPREQTVLIDDGSRLRMVAVTMESGTAEVAMDDGRARALHGTFTDVVVTHEQNAGPVTVDRLEIDLASAEGEGAYDVAIHAEGLGLAGQVVPPFDGHVPLAATRFRWVGTLPDHGSLQSRLETWRTEGGIVEVESLNLDWPPLEVVATGSLALDGQLRPIGAFRGDVVGYRELLDAMETVGMVERSEASVVGAALDFMARTDEDGTRRLAVDISMQHGMLSVGPVPVVPLPPVLPEGAGF
jgi:hypothetical protein